MTNVKAHMLLGALVSDAAALGLHWLYDPARIAEIAKARGGKSAFTPLDAAHYEGVPAYFAHVGRADGMLSQYGEVLLLTIRNMLATGGTFDPAAYKPAFAAHFGAGGTYQGYIDRPTRGALENIAAEAEPTGIDDDQLPAIARLPAILAAYPASGQQDAIKTAMEITNVNDVAAAYGAACAGLLNAVMGGASVKTALTDAAAAATGDVAVALQGALSAGPDSTAFAAEVGPACHLPMGGPVIFQILNYADNYEDAVERNIHAGGDSCGRALMIGAVLGAAYGVATPDGIPLDWVLKLEDNARIWADCQALSGAG